MSEHAWVHENLDAYLTAGLPLAERDRLERHVADCAACAAELSAAKKLDGVLDALFVGARPDAALEDRAIRHLRQAKPPRRSRLKKAAWFVGGVAAVLVLGVLGGLLQALAEDGGLPFPGMKRQAGEARAESRNFLAALRLPAIGRNQAAGLVDILDVSGSMTADSDGVGADTTRPSTTYYDRRSDVSVPGITNPNEAVGIVDGERKAPALSLPPPAGYGTPRQGEIAERLDESKEGKAEHAPRGHTNFQGGVVGGKVKEKLGSDFDFPVQNNSFDYARNQFYGRSGEGKDSSTAIAPGYFGNGYQINGTGLGVGGTGMAGGGSAPGSSTSSALMGGEFGGYAGAYGHNTIIRQENAGRGRDKSETAKQPFDMNAYIRANTPADPGLDKREMGEAKRPNIAYDTRDNFLTPALPSSDSPSSNLGYFKPADSLVRNSDKDVFDITKALERSIDKEKTVRGQIDLEKRDVKENPAASKNAGDAIDKAVSAKQSEPVPTELQKTPVAEPAADTSRKIIRTGEMEFEIESFDKAIVTVGSLIGGVKGGFIATINSDKLPNGKMRGSIVVRMPPQFLDKFLSDLRRELEKSGEMKNQRLGSLDVTKQYTDLESRLRAARTMEERLLNIIKTGKGEIKDLIVAERELGVWRTKIEEMEGEIRYFGNQISLSTITITLTEKEIQAASALVITERVGMRIEVEDVDKAHLDALKAIADEKGRITKSELKQHPAGQLEAIIQVEVAPDKAKKLREVFKKLGNVTFNDIQRVQQAEGGSGKFLDIKTQQRDVQIHVVLYDTANIQPRESVNLLIAADDVQASYRALQTAVRQAHGQIRVGQLKEPDKVNISADFSFDVPMPEKEGIDKVLAKLGVTLSKSDSQVPVNETATDRKFGYRLVLRSLATVPARDTSIQQIAVNDVPKVFRELQDAVLAVKGVIHVQQLNETNKINISAVLSFDVAQSDRGAFDAVLGKLGLLLSSTSAKAGANEITTDRKFGYRLDLLSLASIQPRDTITQQIAANDVPTSFRELQDAVTKVKGIIRIRQLNEQDRLNISADLSFDIPKEDRQTIDPLIAKIGAVLTSANGQAPLDQVATDRKIGYRLKLLNLANIQPRDVNLLTLAANDVPASFNKLQDAVLQAKGVVHVGQLIENNKINVEARLDFDIASADRPAIDKVIAEVGAVLKRSNSQAKVNELASDRKVGYRLFFANVAAIPPRERTTLTIKVDDVDAKVSELTKLVRASKGQASKAEVTQNKHGELTATLLLNVPLSAQDAILAECLRARAVLYKDRKQDPQVADNELATAQFAVTITGGKPIVSDDEGLGAYVSESLTISFRVFAWSVMLVILGLSVVLPWAIVAWVAYRVVRRMRGKPEAAAVG